MKKLLAVVVVLLASACQDYESPGAVADESVWSHVPAGSKPPQVSEREQRQREVAELEERVANLEYRVGRLKSAAEASPDEPPPLAPVQDASARLEAVKVDVRTLQRLYDDPGAFRELAQNARDRLDDVDERLQRLSLPEPVQPQPKS